MLLHSGTNVINEIYDVRQGIDTITSPRMSHAVLKGRVSERGAYAFGIGLFAAAIAVGAYLVWLRGLPIVALGLLGLVAGYTYTAPPFQYKYRALGVPLVFVLMGPIMVVGAYFAITGTWDVRALVLSIPVGPARGGDPPRQRVARHQRGHPGRHRDPVESTSGANGPTTATSPS